MVRTLFFSSEATRGEKEKTTTRLRGGGVSGEGGAPPPALIYGFSGGEKNIKFIFPPQRNKTSHVLICSINLAIHQF